MFYMKDIEEIKKEQEEDNEFKKNFKKQNKVKNEFMYLMSCPHKEFQAEFVKAQAREVCKYLERLKFTPFKSWEVKIREMLEHEDYDYLYQFYITKNEHGEYIPDMDRIDKLVLTDPDPEEFPESRK